MLKGIKAFIFDLDGVITDTSVLHEKAWRKMAAEENIPFDEKLADSLRGVSRSRSLELILKKTDKNYSDNEFQELMNRKNNYYVESLSSLSPDNLLPGAKELLEKIREKGYRLAIASSSKNTPLVIEKLDVKTKVDAVVDGNEITHSKPHPEIFLRAAKKLKIIPQKCVVVEDAASGVEAANAGGFVSVGIGPESRFVLPSQKPLLRYDSVQDLLIYLAL